MDGCDGPFVKWDMRKSYVTEDIVGNVCKDLGSRTREAMFL